ncbi:hypothetical protein LX16_4386 [Stackebrandtia albiflava]|uniref:Peptidase S9 prolyl oligopeptidase catalytic domain-containing protein n=1 Tax=Stackebrandtia albiflava TaxID=406432 RepID=A0A562URB1_9ACTN|nr:alpha/beta fold hydrolase [Stackebrandtia albiflava]TWJ08165.1 hypothetical protein LX16_4386 [Stackebrandtia albiflava]
MTSHDLTGPSESEPAPEPPSATEPASEAPAPAVASRRGSRLRRRLLVAAVAVVALVLVATTGIGWYFSGEVINVTHGEHSFPLKVIAAEAGTVTLPETEETTRPGVWGLHWETGRALLGDVLSTADGEVVRAVVEPASGPLAAGTMARIDVWAYGEDPAQAFDLEFQTVDIDTELGPAPAWYVPASGNTWVIAVHGRNAAPREALRIIPTLHRLGMHVLAVTHRNDEGAPASPDGFHHLGDSEWWDVVAAVDYATAHGAEDVVLYGWSMGGAVTMTALRRMAEPEVVRGVVLDSPVLDWNSTLDKQGAQRSVPQPIVTVAKWLVEWRADLDLEGLDQRAWAADITTPILLFADQADTTVEVSATMEFASLMPDDLITVVETHAGHTASWNEDPDAYDAAVTRFLTT